MTKIISTRFSGGAMFTMPTLLQRRRIRIDGRIRRVFLIFFSFIMSHLFFSLLLFVGGVVFVFVCFLDLHQCC